MKIVRPVEITDAKLVSTNVVEMDYADWATATSYALEDRVQDTATGVHAVYECIQAHTSDAAKHPTTGADGAAYWSEVGATNCWRMFDGTVGQQTSQAASVDVTVAPGEPINTLCILNSQAASVTVTMEDPAEGVVYGPTVHSLLDPAGVDDWYDYFFTPTERAWDTVIEDLPQYANATIRTEFSSSDTVLVGELIYGRARDVGATQYQSSVGIQDYSIKQANDWGQYQIVERAFAKRGEFTVWIDPTTVDALQALLANYRATAAVYIGAAEYGATVLYGYYRDFRIEIAAPTYSVCSITIEGLT